MLQIVRKSYKEKMKKRGKIRLCILGVLLLFVSFSFYFVSVSGDNNWIIDEDRVYVSTDCLVFLSIILTTFVSALGKNIGGLNGI